MRKLGGGIALAMAVLTPRAPRGNQESVGTVVSRRFHGGEMRRWGQIGPWGDMENQAALTAVAALAAGPASSSTVTAAVAPKPGTETTCGWLTGLAAVAGNLTFRLTLTGRVATTVTGPRGAASANGALL